MRAYETGLFDSQRVQLIEGELIDMPAQKDSHAWAISRLVRILNGLFPEPYWIKIEATLRLNDFSAPEPDVAIMSGPPSPPAIETPTPLLIVEVSETTLNYDRSDKASLYAANSIADYWVADVLGKTIEVFREPIRDTSQRYGFGYGNRALFQLRDRVAPLCDASAVVEVNSFLA